MITMSDVCDIIRTLDPRADLTSQKDVQARGTFGTAGMPFDIALLEGDPYWFFTIGACLSDYGFDALELTFRADSSPEYVRHSIGEFLRVCEDLGSLR